MDSNRMEGNLEDGGPGPGAGRTGETVLVLHGPSLSALGRREPQIYGTATLREVDLALTREAGAMGVGVRCLQSNHEGDLIDAILEAPNLGVGGILINAAAYTHSSLAIADALRAAGLPAVDVHLSQIWARGPARRRSPVGAACRGSVSGFGAESYLLGLRGLVGLMRRDG